MTDKDVKICGHGSGNPSIKNLHTYTSQRYANVAPNGKRKGIVAVRRLKAMDDAGRKRFVEAYDIIVGRNVYSQARRGYVYTKYSNGKYYSDCSSSGMAAMRKAGFNVGSWLLNTAAIYTSELFETVPVVIKDGHITNPEVLKVADCILYIGNDPSRPKQIGHVEYVYHMPASKIKVGYDKKFPKLPDRGFFTYGDGMTTLTDKTSRKMVKRVQKLVTWINGKKCKANGNYDETTFEAVKRAQKMLGVAADGEFGKKTLAAAKAYKK